MPREISLTRAEAEELADLLMITDHKLLRGIDDNIREVFGMCRREQEIMNSDRVAKGLWLTPSRDVRLSAEEVANKYRKTK